MSVRNGLVLLVALCAVVFLAGCGGGGSSVAVGTAPPSGAFSKSNLNGTYVFSVSGTDTNGAPYAMVGAITANGNGGITGGAVDINDLEASPIPNAPVNSNSDYAVGADGRGTITLGLPANPFSGNNVTLDFVLQDSSHGLITGFDGNYSGSGTIDLQSANVTPTGSYAFSLSGADLSGSTALPFATVGNFALSGSSISSGLEDFNVNGSVQPDETITAGTLALGPSSTPSTTLTTSSTLGTLTFDAVAIDATHLKLIEMDTVGNLAGDAYSQTSATISSGNLAFTLAGFTNGEVPFAAGGIMVASGGTIGPGSIEDYSSNGTTVSAFNAPVSFSGTYGPLNTDPANSGRNVVTLSGFSGGQSDFAAYPSSGGVLLLEIDPTTLGLVLGAAYSQSSTSFAASQGYGLNLTGEGVLSTVEGNESVEVDDIAEFTASSSGNTVTGVIDENFQPGGEPNPGVNLTGTYTSPDSNGRGQLALTAANSSNSTLNPTPTLTFYTVDGTTFPFIESDAQGQTSTGVFVEQSSSASGSSSAKPAGARAHSLVVIIPPMHPHVLKNKLR